MSRSPRPKPKPAPTRPVAIGVRTTEETKNAAIRAAAADHRTLSAWVELAIVAALKRGEKP